MLTSNPSTVSLSITGMTCGHCVSRVTRTLSGVPNLQVIEVSVGSATVRVTDPHAVDSAIAELQDLGYFASTSPGPAPKPSCGCRCC